MENMTVKERILQFLDIKGISVTKAEKLLGWSKSALLKSNNVSGDKIAELVHSFPDLNTEWLLTGNGPMLKTDPSATVQQSGQNANYQGTFTEPINTIMGSGNITGSQNKISYAQQKKAAMLGRITNNEATELRQENEKLKGEVERLKTENEHLKMSLELKDTVIQAKDDLIKLLSEKK